VTRPVPEGEAVEIARLLTADQRRHILRLIPNVSMMGGFGKDSGCPGLIERAGVNHPIFGSHYHLTPLGLAVRNILQGEQE
jgi:hypothetical protein